jgi:hypothetical protein
MLGIDGDTRVYYEGPAQTGVAIWPAQFISLATVLRSEGDYADVPAATNLGNARLLFREDHFDSVTRIRRGRFYNRASDAQPQLWAVQAHPALPSDSRLIGAGGLIKKQLYGFHDWAARANLREPLTEITIVLGVREAMTLWRVLGIERISTGEDLVTLKSKSNMGVLPEVAQDRLPEAARNRVMEAVGHVVEMAYRASPESIIDRCRDLSAIVLGAYFQELVLNASHKDLGDLARIAKNEKRHLIENSARIINLLHSRGKPNEQSKRGVATPRDEDATLALECAGTIIREVGWAVL